MGARATALLVGHGVPSAPAEAEVALAEFAQGVARLLPAWDVRSATLAAPGALEAALAAVPPSSPLRVFPHFMADGWFVRTSLPRRLRAAAPGAFTMLPPFGLLPGVVGLAIARALTAADVPRRTTLVIAAHGSPSDTRPAAVVEAVAAAIRRRAIFARVEVGFVDQAPFLRDALTGHERAVCLPFFAARGGHVTTDLPRAAEAARFTGPILAPIGTDAQAVRLIAAALTDAATGAATRPAACACFR